MQMLNIKPRMQTISLLFLILTPFSLCSANANFYEHFQTEPLISESLANRITEYYSEDIPLPLPQQRIELLNIETQLNNQEKKHSDNAVYWFIKGLNHRNIASYYVDNNNLPLANSHVNSKNNAYKKAIELGNTPKNQLTAPIFSTMKHGLPEDMKIEATKNEIALGGNGESDSYYWYLHWSNIDQLKKAGRKDEALAAYKKMQAELKNSGMDMSIYNSLTKKIESETLKGIKTEKPANKPQAKKVKTHKKPKEPEKSYDRKYIIIVSVILFSAIIIIAVAIYEFIQKRKKIIKRMTS